MRRPPVRSGGTVIWPVLPGRLYLSGTLKKHNAEQLLAEHRVDLVLNVGQHDAALETIAEYRHVRIPDSVARVPAAELDDLVDLAARTLTAGRRVLVMCYGGRNRSALLAALVLVRATGCSGEEAYARIRAAKASTFYNELYGSYVRGLPAPAGEPA